MRNTIKILAIALAAIIVFGVASCGDNDGEPGGGEAISGNTIVLGAEVVYDSDIEDLIEAKKETNFNFYEYYNDYYDGVKPLSYYLDGTPSVTVNNNKVTIILGTPKPNFLDNLSAYLIFMGGGITVNPIDAKFFVVWPSTSDGKYWLFCMKSEEQYGCLIYADRDVTVKGTGTIEYENDDDAEGGYEEEATFNMSLKKGWNYIFTSYNGKTHTCTASTSQPSGYKWTVQASGGGGGSYEGGGYDDDYYYDDDDYDDDD